MSDKSSSRLRRSRRRWRIIAVFAIAAAVVLWMRGRDDAADGPYVGRFSVTGVIVNDSKRDALLRKLAEDEDLKGLIVRIDSPGGTVVGSEALYEGLRDIAEDRPVVAVMGEAAASGGYITALAADQIFARGGTVTASVGVIFAAPNFHRLLDTVGVEMVEIKSGEMKAEPAPYAPVDLEKLEGERILVADSFAWFKDLAQERRNLDDAAVELISDGRIMTGRMAAEMGLIDAIGDESDARDWLTARGVDADAPIHDRRVPEESGGVLSWLLGRAGAQAVSGTLESAARFTDTSPHLWVLYR